MSQPGSTSLTLDRRRSPRRPTPLQQSIAWLRRGHHLYPAQVIDESDLGIGLYLKQAPPFEIGQNITIEWLRKQLETYAGTIRAIETTTTDCWRIGIEWSE
jgi:hypothetical protein